MEFATTKYLKVSYKAIRRKNLFRDIIFIYLLFAFCIFIRYFLPKTLGDIAFIALFVFSLISKKYYFWLAFYLLLFSAPGFLFSPHGNFGLPTFQVGGLGREIFFNELVSISFIIKAFFQKTKLINIYYRKTLLLILAYSIVLLLLGLLYGVSLLKLLRTIRFMLPMLLLFAIPWNILNKEKNVIYFINLIFALVFLCFLAQLSDIISGRPLAAFFGETRIRFAGKEAAANELIFNVNEKVIRTIYGIYIIFIGFCSGLFYTINKQHPWRKNYILIVIAVCFLSVFFSATRGWFIAFSVILIMYLIYFPKKLSITFNGIILIVIFILISPKLEKQIAGSFDRIGTLGAIAYGDETAEGSLKRLSERGPVVLNKFKESPIVGFGFSEEYYLFADGHVGNQTLLLNGGIVGYLIYLMFWFEFIFLLYKRIKYSKALAILIFSFVGLFIIHSTSRMIFSYSLEVEDAIGLGVFFAFANFYYYKSRSMHSVKNK